MALRLSMQTRERILRHRTRLLPPTHVNHLMDLRSSVGKVVEFIALNNRFEPGSNESKPKLLCPQAKSRHLVPRPIFSRARFAD